MKSMKISSSWNVGRQMMLQASSPNSTTMEAIRSPSNMLSHTFGAAASSMMSTPKMTNRSMMSMTHWQTLLLSTRTALLRMLTPLSEVVAERRYEQSWKQHLFLKPFFCFSSGSAADCVTAGCLKAVISAGTDTSLCAGEGLFRNECCLKVERKAETREKLAELISGAAMRTLARCKSGVSLKCFVVPSHDRRSTESRARRTNLLLLCCRLLTPHHTSSPFFSANVPVSI